MTQVNEQQKLEWVELELRLMKREKKTDRALWWVLVVMTGLVFLSGIASAIMFFLADSAKSLETTINQLLMSVLALLCFLIPVFFKRKLKIHVPSFLLIVIYLFIYAHFILGEIYRIYDTSMIFDKVLHTTSGVVIACIGISVVFALANMKNERVKLSPFFVVLFSFCFALAIEYVWELFEYAVDRIAGANMQRWQDSIIGYDEAGNAIHSLPWGNGIADSMGDMAVNVLGALVVCVITYVILVKKPGWMTGVLIVSEKKLRLAAQARVEEAIAQDVPVPDFKGMMEAELQKRKRRKREKEN